MYAHEEAEFERKAEQMLKGQRELQAKRDFRCFVERFRTDTNDPTFNNKFNLTFPDAPDSPTWWAERYCPICQRNRKWCECGTYP